MYTSLGQKMDYTPRPTIIHHCTPTWECRWNANDEMKESANKTVLNICWLANFLLKVPLTMVVLRAAQRLSSSSIYYHTTNIITINIIITKKNLYWILLTPEIWNWQFMKLSTVKPPIIHLVIKKLYANINNNLTIFLFSNLHFIITYQNKLNYKITVLTHWLYKLYTSKQ